MQAANRQKAALFWSDVGAAARESPASSLVQTESFRRWDSGRRLNSAKKSLFKHQHLPSVREGKPSAANWQSRTAAAAGSLQQERKSTDNQTDPHGWCSATPSLTSSCIFSFKTNWPQDHRYVNYKTTTASPESATGETGMNPDKHAKSEAASEMSRSRSIKRNYTKYSSKVQVLRICT